MSEPRIGVADLAIDSPDGTFEIGRESFPQFAFLKRLGVHVQSERVRIAHPDPAYVEAALTALREACRQLGVPGLRYGFEGAFTTDYPTYVWVLANWTGPAELRGTVRHEAAHLAFARTHTAEESAGHTGPSEDFAKAFERDQAT